MPCRKTACCGGMQNMPDASSKENREAVKATQRRRKFSPLSLKVFTEKRKLQCLMPLCDNEWEYIEFILGFWRLNNCHTAARWQGV